MVKNLPTVTKAWTYCETHYYEGLCELGREICFDFFELSYTA